MIAEAAKIIERIRHRYELYRYVAPFARARAELPESTIHDNILLFTQPRSGSTWLANVLLAIPNTQLVDEPFNRGPINLDGAPKTRHQGKFDEIRELDTWYYQPVPAEAEWPEMEEAVRKLLKLEIPKRALYWEADVRQLADAKHFIFKFCYANLMLPWMLRKFGIKPIVLVRHPCAVVHSQMQMSHWESVMQFAEMSIPDFRFSEVFQSHRAFFSTLKSPEEQLAFIWCVNAMTTIAHPLNNKAWCTVSYEHLVSDFEAETDRLFRWLHLDKPAGLTDIKDQPSQFTQAYAMESLGSEEQLTSWQTRLSSSQIKRILAVLEYFGIEAYSQDPLPDRKRLLGN